MQQKEKPKYRSHHSYRGERATHKIASVVGKKSWKWGVMNLAWTAGPVTFVALSIGHYLGFGSAVSMRTFYYFAVYTVVASVLTLIAGIARDAFYQPKIEQEQAHLLHIIDRMFAMAHLARDIALSQLDPDERRIMAAYYILSSVGASPSDIGAAVSDLTNDSKMTRAARNIQTFADRGMYSRVAMIQDSVRERLEVVREKLQPIAPQAYDVLEKRLCGSGPKLFRGKERCEGFIERVLLAAEENNESLMTLQDALEMIWLTLELLNGRVIAVLDTRMKGDEELERAQSALDDARHHYRISIRRRNSQIRLLAESLYDETDYDLVVKATNKTQQLVESIVEALVKLPHAQRVHYRKPYESILVTNARLKAFHSKLLQAEAAYSKRWRRYGQKLVLTMQSSDLKQAGFYILERNITLTDKQKLRLSHVISSLLPEDLYTISETKLKHMVMEMANELDDLIDMSQPEEQLAIESSNVTDFGFITSQLSPATKAGWSALAIDAMHEDRRKASHRMARDLVGYYRVPLTPSIIGFLCEQFGADEEHLEQLNDDVLTLESRASSVIPTPPLELKSWEALYSFTEKPMNHAT